MSEVKGLRYNKGKLPFHLISPLAMRELARVLGKGAEKYAERNWENGLVWTECEGSLERHLTAWKLGEDYDPESGCLHMAHVLTNAMFLLHFQLTGTGEDDRPKYKEVLDAQRDTDPIGGPEPESVESTISRYLSSVYDEYYAIAKEYALESRGLSDDEADVRKEAGPE